MTTVSMDKCNFTETNMQSSPCLFEVANQREMVARVKLLVVIETVIVDLVSKQLKPTFLHFTRRYF